MAPTGANGGAKNYNNFYKMCAILQNLQMFDKLD